jgi:hypothetical protein
MMLNDLCFPFLSAGLLQAGFDSFEEASVIPYISYGLAWTAAAVILVTFFVMKNTKRYCFTLVTLPLALAPAFFAWLVSAIALIQAFRAMANEGSSGGVAHIGNLLVVSNHLPAIGHQSSTIPLLLLLLLGIFSLRRQNDHLDRSTTRRTLSITALTIFYLFGTILTVQFATHTLTLPLVVVGFETPFDDTHLPMYAAAKQALNLDSASVPDVSETLANGLLNWATMAFIMIALSIGFYILGLFLTLLARVCFPRWLSFVGWLLVLSAMIGTGLQKNRHDALDREIFEVIEHVIEASPSSVPDPPR